VVALMGALMAGRAMLQECFWFTNFVSLTGCRGGNSAAVRDEVWGCRHVRSSGHHCRRGSHSSDALSPFGSITGMKAKGSKGVARFSVSLPAELAEQLERMTREKGYDNRSLAVADMIRAHLVEHRQQFGDEEIAGTITLLYDHHKQHVQAALTDIQHDHHEVIIATLHVHLDHHNCMELLAVRGKAAVIKRIADELIAAKGVKHGKLTVTSTGKDLPT
jgi:CopG family transcriptional regulator, nickel-responsive regulator